MLIDSCGWRKVVCFWRGFITSHNMFPTEDMSGHNEYAIEGNNTTQLNALPSSPESKTPDDDVVAPPSLLKDLVVLTQAGEAVRPCSGRGHDAVVGGKNDGRTTMAFPLKRNGGFVGLYGLAPQSFCDVVFLQECMMAGQFDIVIDVLHLLSHGLALIGHDVEDFWPGCLFGLFLFVSVSFPLSFPRLFCDLMQLPSLR